MFYVGKGQRDRLLAHMSEAEDAEIGRRPHTSKIRRIAELLEEGLEPEWTIISRNHAAAAAAEVVETAVMMALSTSQNGPI